MEVAFHTGIELLGNLCEHWFIRLYNHRIHPSPSNLPQIFLSGELHGDERVAPIAIMELVFSNVICY